MGGVLIFSATKRLEVKLYPPELRGDTGVDHPDLLFKKISCYLSFWPVNQVLLFVACSASCWVCDPGFPMFGFRSGQLA